MVQGHGLPAVVATEVIAATAAAVASWACVLVFHPHERLRVNLRQLLQKSAIFNVYAFVGNLYDRLDVVLLSKLAGGLCHGHL
jgi:hypothetical protein